MARASCNREHQRHCQSFPCRVAAARALDGEGRKQMKYLSVTFDAGASFRIDAKCDNEASLHQLARVVDRLVEIEKILKSPAEEKIKPLPFKLEKKDYAE
jgi:hypothetical protein